MVIRTVGDLHKTLEASSHVLSGACHVYVDIGDLHTK